MTSAQTNNTGSNALLRGIQVLNLVDDTTKKLNDTKLEMSSAATTAAQQRVGKERGMTAVVRGDWKTQYQPLSKEQHDGNHQSGTDNSDQKTLVGRPSSRVLELRENSKAMATHMTLNKEHHTDSDKNINRGNLGDKLPKRNSEVRKRKQSLEESAGSLLTKQRDTVAQLSLIRTSGRTSDRLIRDSGTDLKKEIKNVDGKSSNEKTKEWKSKMNLDNMETLDIRWRINSTNSLAAKSRKERSESSDRSLFRVAKSDDVQARPGSVTATKREFNSSASSMGNDAIQNWEKKGRKAALSVEMQGRKRARHVSDDTGQPIGIKRNKTQNDADQIMCLDRQSMKSTTLVNDDVEKTKRNADLKENTGKGIKGSVKVPNNASYGIKSENAIISNDTEAKTETNSHDLIKRQKKVQSEGKREGAEGGVKKLHLEQKTKIYEARSSDVKANGQIVMQNGNDGDDVDINRKNTEKNLRIMDKSEMLINKRSSDGEKKHNTKKVKVQKEAQVHSVAMAENELAEKRKQTSKLNKSEAEGIDTSGVRRGMMKNADEAKTYRHETVDSQNSEQRIKLKGVINDEKSNLEEHHSESVRKIRRTKNTGNKLKTVIVTEERGLNETISEEHSSDKNKDKDVEKEPGLESLASASQNSKAENVEPSKLDTTVASKKAKNLFQDSSLSERKDSETERSKESHMLTECDKKSTSRDEIVEDILIMDCDDSQRNDESEQKTQRIAYSMRAPATAHHGPRTQTKTEGWIIARKELQKVARKLDFGSQMLLPMKTVVSNYPESFEKRHFKPTTFDVSPVSKGLVEASLKQSRAKVTRRVQRRFEDLRQFIEFDVWSMEIFHLLPLTEYALYMRIYGMSNTRQAYTQTGEDNISTEVQTDDVSLRSQWCQHPNHPGIEPHERDHNEVTLWNSERLSRFLLNAGKVITSLLEETALQHLDFTQCSSPETATFSYGCIELGLVSFLKDRHVISGQFSMSDSQFLLLVYSQPTKISEDEKLSQKGIICLWNLSTPDKPLKVMVSEAEPLCCCLSPSKPTVAFAGMNDGTLSVWDMRESSFSHMSYQDNTEEWVLRRPTFNTVALLNRDNHSSPVVSIAPILGPSGHRDSRQDTGIPVGKEECLAFQLASLEIGAVIVLWVVTEMMKPKEVSSEADFCLSAGGRIRLTKTRMITLEIPAIRTKCSSRCQKVFEKPFLGLGLQLLPYDNCHYYVTTDVGCIVHGLHHGGRANPSVHFHKLDMFTEVSAFDFCPFDQSYFLAGHRDGSVCLYTTQQVQPVAVWRNTTENNSSISAVHFSRSRPGTFFVLDENSYLYTWNLLESTDSPVNQDHLSHSRVTHVCLSTHTKFIGSGLECRQPHMAIFTESGTCSIRKFSKRLSKFCSSDADAFKLMLRKIS